MNGKLNQRGAVAALVAILLVLIMVCVSFVVDLGHIHNVKVLVQAGVDSGALSGALKIPGDPDDEIKPAAVAAFNTNMEGSAEPVTITVDNVEVGHWDKDALGQPASVRFEADPEDDPINAVKVTASVDVNHFFFWFLPSTTVTVDAIAVNVFEEQTVPLALVSCIPTGGAVVNIETPGLSVCDITTYYFHPSPSLPVDDTAAWSSLTIGPASQTNILEFLDEEGVQVFNQIVYGTGLAHDGIENTTVETDTRDLPVPDFPAFDAVDRGCQGNDGTSINCGLGPDPSLDPTDYDDIRKYDPGKLVGVTQAEVAAEPLAYNPLPRWYHFGGDGNPPPATGPYDPWDNAFIRLVTQDGQLLGNQAELQALYEGTVDPFGPTVYNTVDYRFTEAPSGPGEKFVKYVPAGGGEYKPDFNKVLEYTGYPPVWVNNGTVQPALTNFLDGLINELPPGGPATGSFRSELADYYYPFETGNESDSGGAGVTIRVTLPVIFAGDCEEWKALGQANNHKLYYIGTASFLLTRAWQTGDCYQHNENFITITNQDPDEGTCGPTINASDYVPAITGSLGFQCTGGSAPNAAIEGVWQPPVQGEETEAGVVKVYLVE